MGTGDVVQENPQQTGGFSGHGRRQARHGTYSGYQMHILYGIPFPEGTRDNPTGKKPCGCRKANNEYKAANRAKHGKGRKLPVPAPVTFRPAPDD